MGLRQSHRRGGEAAKMQRHVQGVKKRWFVRALRLGGNMAAWPDGNMAGRVCVQQTGSTGSTGSGGIASTPNYSIK